jgi:hypothetical protein
VNASRENVLAPVGGGATGMLALVNGAGLRLNLLTFRTHGAIYDSSSANNRTRAFSVGTQRNITPRITASADFLRAIPSRGNRTSSLVGTVREKIRPRLRLDETLQIGPKQRTFGFGGSLESNWISVSLEYQTIYIPFFVPGVPSFQQVALVHLRLLLPHDLELNGDTNVTPLGRVRYTAYATAFDYREGSAGGTPFSPGPAYKFHDCVARGRVLDTQRTPVPEVAFRIGPNLVFSDWDGIFLSRFPNCRTYSFHLSPEDSLTAIPYKIVSAPDTVTATRQEHSLEVTVILQRIPAPPSP